MRRTIFVTFWVMLALLCSMMSAAYAQDAEPVEREKVETGTPRTSFVMISDDGETVLKLFEDGTAIRSFPIGDFKGTWYFDPTDSMYHLSLDNRMEMENYILEKDGENDWCVTIHFWFGGGKVQASTFVSTANKLPEPKEYEVEGYYEAQLPQIKEGYAYVEAPAEYEQPAEQQGTLEVLTYQSYNTDNELVEDLAYVYLPYGYDPADTQTKDNIFYISHGAGGNFYSLFFNSFTWPEQNPTVFKNILDNMIANGDMEPMIVVTPTFLVTNNPEFYQKNCFVQCLLPAVEGKYNTYAEGVTPEDFKASREHRAFGGYSMGAMNTWYCFINNLDYVKWFAPMSGALRINDASASSSTAETLAQAVADHGFSTTDFYIYTHCGGFKDIAYAGLGAQIVEMAKLGDTFIYTNDFSEGNLHHNFAYADAHNDSFAPYYVYNYLPTFFKNYAE